MSEIYHAYAPYYDGSGQMRFAILVAQYLGDLLQHHPVAGRRMLDVACGTGTLALMLADHGWDVVGVDASAAMLAMANAKSANLETTGSTRFLQGDMRSFAESGVVAHGAFDLVTCTYDSLNYMLNEAELAACFRNMALALAPGGLLMVDMNTRHFLEYDWPAVSVQEGFGFVQIDQSVFDPHTECSTMLVSGFVGDDEQGYQRFNEVHVERAYAPELVADLIASTGLVPEAAYDCFTLQSFYPTSQRIAWIARKKEDAR